MNPKSNTAMHNGQSEHRLTLRISFDLSTDTATVRAMAEKAGHTFEEWRSEAVEALREDLDRELGPAEDWQPFDLSPFEITLIEADNG